MAHWDYGEHGPATWQQICKDVSWQKQSPINIETAKAIHNPDLVALSFNYTPEDNAELTNNGHSVQCNIKSKSVLSGGPLEGEYRLQQFHLHWGSKDEQGSEHTIDGKQYSAELHLVHYNTKYGDFKAALSEDDGLAVVGIMVEVGLENQAFRPIAQEITEKNLREKGSDAKTSCTLNPDLLVPNNQSAYWTYAGSLTTPPLLECVCWILFKEPIQFSKDQLKELRTLLDDEGHAIQDNFRPPVSTDKNDRPVQASFK